MTPICLPLLLWLQLGPLPSVLKTPAQESKPAAEEAKPKGPQPIPVSEIPDRLREAAAIVRSASGHATPLPRIQQIESELPRLSKELEELSATSHETLRSNPTRSLVNELSSAWSVNRRTLDEWQDTLKSRSESLQQDLSNLRRDTEQWNVTRVNAETQELPQDVVDRIDQMLKQFSEAERAVLERRNTILDAQNKISTLRVDIDRASEEIASVMGAQRGELWQFDSPPIWELFRRSTPQLRGLSRKTESLTKPADVVKFYASTVLIGFVVQVFTFAIILAGLLVLRRKGIHTLEDEDTAVQAAVAVLRRPVSAALLLSIVIGVIVQGEMPQVLIELGGLVLLVPLLRVIPRILSSEVKPALWLLAALYVADNSISLLAKYPLATRLVVLTMMASTLGGLIWLDGRLRSRLLPGGWKRVTLFFIRLAMVLLAFAFVCELTGATLLGEFLLTGALKTIPVSNSSSCPAWTAARTQRPTWRSAPRAPTGRSRGVSIPCRRGTSW